MHTLEVLGPLLVPLITGLVGAAGLAFRERRQVHDRRTMRANVIAEATAEVTFAHEWWSAQQALGAVAAPDSTARAAQLLANAEAKVASLQELPVEDHERVPLLQRLFLLRPVHGRGAKILRVLFWLCLVFLALEAGTLAIDASSKGDRAYLGADVVWSIISLLLAPILHEATDAADKHASRREERAPDAPVAQPRFN